MMVQSISGCVKNLQEGNQDNVYCLCDCNWTRTQNHLVRERTLNNLAKLGSCLDIQATIECGFTLKRVSDMTRTYSQTSARA